MSNISIPLFTRDTQSFYSAAFAHNAPFATAGPYQTVLTADEEIAFRTWVTSSGVSFDVDAAIVNYDMRGLWLSASGVVVLQSDRFYMGASKVGEDRLASQDSLEHPLPSITLFPETFKTPYSTSFSELSMYAIPGTPFVWRGPMVIDTRTGQIIYWPGYIATPDFVVLTTNHALSLDRLRRFDTARAAMRRSHHGRVRQCAPRNFWLPNDLPGIGGIGKDTPSAGLDRGSREIVGSSVWRLTVHRRGHPVVDVTDKVTGFSWTQPKDSAIETGTVTWIDPKGVVAKKIVRSGDLMVLEHAAKKGAQFSEVWQYRMREPTFRESTGERTFILANDLLNLQNSTDDFKFKKGKDKPLGWRVDEVVRYVCDRYGVKAVIPFCKARVTNRTWLATDALTVINDAYRVERLAKGRRFVLGFRKGVLVVTPLKRSKVLATMGRSLIEAVLTETFEETFATAITVRANPTEDKKKDAKGHKTVQGFKLSVDLESLSATKRWGYVHRLEYVHGLAKSAAEVRQLGLRHLAKIAKPHREVTLTHPGNPTVKKGDAIYVQLKDLRLRVLVWVAEVTHTVDPTGYTMEMTCVFDDPYANVAPDRVDENEPSAPVKPAKLAKKLGKQPAVAAVRINSTTSKVTAFDKLAEKANVR